MQEVRDSVYFPVILVGCKAPREDTGKLFKRELRDPYWAGVTRRV